MKTDFIGNYCNVVLTMYKGVQIQCEDFAANVYAFFYQSISNIRNGRK